MKLKIYWLKEMEYICTCNRIFLEIKFMKLKTSAVNDFVIFVI